MGPPPTTTRPHRAGRRAASRLALEDVPPEVIERIVAFLKHSNDIASVNAVSRLFRGAPGSRSPVEHALRERARRRGHAHASPKELPTNIRTWTEELLARECVFDIARMHSHAAVAGGRANTAFSAFVDTDGGLHTCGEVYEDDGDENPGALRAVSPDALGHSELHELPVLLPMRVASLASVRIRSVAAGCDHLLALGERGTVYVCGTNGHGQLGLGDQHARECFVPLRSLQAELVVCVDAGSGYSCAIGAGGAVYSWGGNHSGQLGHGDTKQLLEPRRIEALDGVRIAGLSAGDRHTLLVSASGVVYACGYGEDGCLGLGDDGSQCTPQRVEALAGVRAVHVSAGWSHSLVVDAKGGVHSFGSGVDGCLGHGVKARHFVPKRIAALADVRAVRASAGYCTSAVLGVYGSVHTFGYTDDGRLGLGKRRLARLPERVQALAHEHVHGCSMGPSHTLFVTSAGVVHSCGEQSGALGHGVSMASVAKLSWPWLVDKLPPVRVASL